MVAGCSDSSTTTAGSGPPAPTYPALTFSDNDVLNFALNLEYLEAEFYLRAATGSGLSDADAGSGAGAVVGGTAVPGLSGLTAEYLNEIAQDELNHVRFIQSAISGNSGTPVSRPAINFTDTFNTLASLAGIGSAFDPFSSFNAFLVGAFVFEDVGVTAYQGAAPAISNNKILTAAVQIHAVEAYHAAEVRTLLAYGAATSGDSTYLSYADKISALRGSLGGGNEVPPGTITATSVIAASTADGRTFARTTSQVLHIVYGTGGGAGVSKGGFFPNGLNGSVTTTSA